jgi:hypothetical protein
VDDSMVAVMVAQAISENINNRQNIDQIRNECAIDPKTQKMFDFFYKLLYDDMVKNN